MLWESKYALKMEPDGIKVVGALENNGLQALWFLEWQRPRSSVSCALLNYAGWPGEIGFRRLWSHPHRLNQHQGMSEKQQSWQVEVMIRPCNLILCMIQIVINDTDIENTLGKKKCVVHT